MRVVTRRAFSYSPLDRKCRRTENSLYRSYGYDEKSKSHPTRHFDEQVDLIKNIFRSEDKMETSDHLKTGRHRKAKRVGQY